MSENWIILNVPFSLILKSALASGRDPILPWSTVSLGAGTAGSAGSWSGDSRSVHCGRGSTASTPKRTSAAVTTWSVLPENLLVCTQIPPGRLFHGVGLNGGGPPTLMPVTTRSSALSASSSASATYSHALCSSVPRYRSVSTRCHVGGSSPQLEGGSFVREIHTFRSVTMEVDDITGLKGRLQNIQQYRLLQLLRLTLLIQVLSQIAVTISSLRGTTFKKRGAATWLSSCGADIRYSPAYSFSISLSETGLGSHSSRAS